MASFNKFQPFVENLCEGKFNFSSDTLKCALTNTLPVNTQGVLDLVTNHPPPANANGYTTGGHAVTVNSHAQSGGTFTLGVTADIEITATAGGIGPFQYVVLYDDTASGNELIGWWDYGSEVNLASGEKFTIDFTTSIFTLA